MWYIQSISEADRKIVVLPGKEYVIGRKDCDIVIDNDPSVSRKHAVLKVAYSSVNTDCSNPPTLSLTDVSKFGTFINNKAVKGQKALQHGDEIRFGLPKSAHRVVHEPLVVTMSCLDKNGKKEVRTLVSQLGGVISNDWRKDCSFLIMKTVTVTIKVVCALASQKGIVTVDYLSELHKHLKGEIAVEPKPENYLPTVTENLIRPGVSFHPTAKRSGVFIGMTFYFLSSKQFHKMNLAIELGGGVPILSDDPTSDLEAFLEANTAVMNPAPGEVTEKAQKDWVEKVRKFLLKRNKYMVQDAEVGYAVLYCSTEDYCNPDKDVSHLLSVPLASQSLSSQAVDVNSQAVGRPSQATPASQPVFKRPGPPKQDRGDISVPGTTSSVLVEEIITESETVSQQDTKGKGRGKRARSPAPFTVDSEVKVKEETLTPEHEQSSGSRSGVARRTRDRAGAEAAPTGRQTRSRSPAPSEEDTKQQSRSRSRSPAPSEEDTSQKQARSRSPVGKRGASKKGGSAVRADLEARSRSPSRTLVVPDTETSPSVIEEAKNASVKKEVDDGASAQTSNTLTSQALFDSDLPPVSKTKKEKVESLADSRPFTMLDDEDDDIIQPARKPPPARQKRKVSISSDEDDPFDFAHKKRQKGDKKSGSHGNDDDDNQPARKPPPAKQKRKVSISSDEDDPFDFALKKRQRAEKKSDDENDDDDPFSIAPTKKQSKPSTSRGGDGGTRARSPGPGSRSSRSRSPAAKDQSSRSESQRARSPAAKDQGSRSSRSPSPGPKRLRGARSPSPAPETESVAVADREERSDMPLSRSSQNGNEGRQPYTGIRLQGWLTTCLPMAEQVTANKDFEPEDIKRPLLTVAYADLVVRTFGDRRRRQQTNNTTEDTTDTATDGMVKWEGKLVRNFKKFRKTKHAQVGQLRRIIGGSDLAEHSSGSRKFLDNWLKDLQEVESQESQREKEMDALFGWQPVKSAKGKGGGGVGSRRGR